MTRLDRIARVARARGRRLALTVLLGALTAPLGISGCGAGGEAPRGETIGARPSASDDARPSETADLAKWIEAYVAAFGQSWGEGYAFSGYLAVLRDGDVVFGKGYGKADRGSGVVADRSTRFRIGSITKQLTAAAVLWLVERGKIGLDDPISKLVPEAPASWSKIAVHHLLSHTSGIPEYASAELLRERDKPRTRAQMLAAMRERPLDFEPPGSRFAYSNSNYYLLGVLIERASGTSYDAFLRERVLAPAGMTRTSTESAPNEAGAAIGYTLDDLDRVVPAHPADMSIPFAAGALRSTVDDLAAWDRALAGAGVLSARSIERMFTAVRGDYAYGWNRSRFAGHDVASHTGRIDGFTAYIARALDARVTVVALSNNDMFEARQVGGAALEMALTGKRTPPPVERPVLPIDEAFAARVIGEYRLTEASRAALAAKVPKEIIDSAMGMTISREEDRLFMKPSGQQRVRVFRGGADLLFTKRDPLDLVLAPAAAGSRVEAITLTQAGVSGTYERAPSNRE